MVNISPYIPINRMLQVTELPIMRREEEDSLTYRKLILAQLHSERWKELWIRYNFEDYLCTYIYPFSMCYVF